MLDLVPPTHCTTWDAFVAKVATLDSAWVYRGDLESRKESRKLVSSLERACDSWNVPLADAGKVERRLLREFQRHPEAGRLGLDLNDHLCWYAAMQHHGAPTRLLDWTYSPFVAAYFALDRLLSTLPAAACVTPGREPAASNSQPMRAAVWALNTATLTTVLREVLKEDWALYARKDSDAFGKLYVERPTPITFMGIVNPLRLNERLSVQQGLFLCPGNVGLRWIENLSVLRNHPEAIQLLVLDETLLDPAFKELARMNVTARSLLPGLDGYAKSLLHRLKLLAELPID